MEKNKDAPPLEEPSAAAANSGGGGGEEEESGWTDYLEDYFSSSDIEREKSFLCSSIGSCSDDGNTTTNVLSPTLCSVGEVFLDSPKKLICFKKLTRTQKIFQDDSLEDTATSPVHSPKVADLKVKTKHVNLKFDDHAMIRGSMGSDYSEGEKGVCTAAGGDLKQRGLCLFPFSMLLHYQDFMCGGKTKCPLLLRSAQNSYVEMRVSELRAEDEETMAQEQSST